jgi:hypothetical protein
MTEASWTEISLETVGCVVLLVLAFKLYRMRVSTESECCGGALHMEASNPGNETPPILRGIMGDDQAPSPLTLEDLERIVQSKLQRTTNDLNSDLMAIRELKKSDHRDPPPYPPSARPDPLRTLHLKGEEHV